MKFQIGWHHHLFIWSRPARALWIEMYTQPVLRQEAGSRGPRGPCGLKFSFPGYASHHISGSRPARALWIEIISTQNHIHPLRSRPARALWIEIVNTKAPFPGHPGRGPRGPCGLKSHTGYGTGEGLCGRGPRGPCGLKCTYCNFTDEERGRGPRGPCGLK